jgi:hypothetical protein
MNKSKNNVERISPFKLSETVNINRKNSLNFSNTTFIESSSVRKI